MEREKMKKKEAEKGQSKF